MFRSILQPLLYRNIRLLSQQYIAHLKEAKTILDIGCGNGLHALILANVLPQAEINTLDLGDYRWEKNSAIKHIIYDGDFMPIKNKHCDASLLFFVLHHAVSAERVLRETKRVTKKTIVIAEEIYVSRLQKIAMELYDFMLNLIIFGEPITIPEFRTDRSWREMFGHLGMKVVSTKTLKRSWFYPPQRMLYILQV